MQQSKTVAYGIQNKMVTKEKRLWETGSKLMLE